MNFIDTVRTLLSNASRTFSNSSQSDESVASENAGYIQQIVASGLSYITRYTKDYKEKLSEVVQFCSSRGEKVIDKYQDALSALNSHGVMASSLLNVLLADSISMSDDKIIATETNSVEDSIDEDNDQYDSSAVSLSMARKRCRDYLDSKGLDWSDISQIPAVTAIQQEISDFRSQLESKIGSDGLSIPLLRDKVSGDAIATNIIESLISTDEGEGIISSVGDALNMVETVESTLSNPSELTNTSYWTGLWDKVSAGMISVGVSARQWISTMKDIWTHDDFSLIDKFAVSLSVLTNKTVWTQADTTANIATDNGLSYGDVLLAGVKQSAQEAYEEVNNMLSKVRGVVASLADKAWGKVRSWIRPSWVDNTFIEMTKKGSLLQPDMTLMSVNSGMNVKLNDVINAVSSHPKHNALTVNNAYRTLYFAKSLTDFKPNGFEGNVKVFTYLDPSIDEGYANPIHDVIADGTVGDGTMYGSLSDLQPSDIKSGVITMLNGSSNPVSSDFAFGFNRPIGNITLHINMGAVPEYSLSHLTVRVFRAMRGFDVLDAPLSSNNMPSLLDRDTDYSLVQWSSGDNSCQLKGVWTEISMDLSPDANGMCSVNMDLVDAELLKIGVFPQGNTFFIIKATYSEVVDASRHYKIGVRHHLLSGLSILSALRYMYDLVGNGSSPNYCAQANNWSKITEYHDSIISKLSPISGSVSSDDIVLTTGYTPIELISWWLDTTRTAADSKFDANEIASILWSKMDQSDAAIACFDLVMSQFWSSFYYDIFETTESHRVSFPAQVFGSPVEYLSSMSTCGFITLTAHPDANAIKYVTDDDGDPIVPVLSWYSLLRQLITMIGDKMGSARAFHSMMSNQFTSNLAHDGIGETLNYITGYTWLDISNALTADTYQAKFNDNYISYLWDAPYVRSRYQIDDLYTYAREIELNRQISRRVLQFVAVAAAVFVVTTVVGAYLGKLSYVNTVQINHLLYDVDVNAASPSTYKHNNFKLQWRYRWQKVLDGLRGLLNPLNWIKAVASVTKTVVTKVSSIGAASLKKLFSVFDKSDDTNKYVKEDLSSVVLKLSKDVR